METFSDFYKDSVIIGRISKSIAESKNIEPIRYFVKSLNDREALNIFEAWYNPMDWVRGAGRFAATRFAAEPQVDHIEQLFHSLSHVIQKAGKYREFQNLLSAMNKQIQDLKTGSDARAAEFAPADPTQEPTASGAEAKTSSKDPADKTDNAVDPDDIIRGATGTQTVGTPSMTQNMDDILRGTSQTVGTTHMSYDDIDKLVQQRKHDAALDAVIRDAGGIQNVVNTMSLDDIEKLRQQHKFAAGKPYARHMQMPQGGKRHWGSQYALGK